MASDKNEQANLLAENKLRKNNNQPSVEEELQAVLKSGKKK